MKIGHKLTLSFLASALLVGFLGYIVAAISKNVLQHTIGENSVSLVTDILDKIDRDVYNRIEMVQVYAKDSILQRAIQKSNQEFDSLQNVTAYIDMRDKEWVSTTKKEITPFMQELMSNSLSKELIEKMQFYERKYGYAVFPEIYAANKHGVVVALTGRTSDYLQADEEWYQKAVKEKDFWVGEVEYDESSGTYACDIVVNLYDENGDFAGILKAILDIKEIVRIIKEAEAAAKYRTAGFKLVTRNGKLIYSIEEVEFFKDISDKLFSRIKGREEQCKHFVAEGDDPGEPEELFAYAYSKGYRDFKGLGWILINGHETKELFAPIERLQKIIITISIILTVLAILIGTITSRTISKPIMVLKGAMEKVSKGNLNLRVETCARDEIGQLSRTFNQMVGQIKEKNKKLAANKDRAENAVREINDDIMKIAGGDYSVQARVSDKNDIYDSLAMGINMMIDDTRAANEQINQRNQELIERVKELNCLYGVSNLVEEKKSLDEILQSTVELLPSGWQYPNITCARIMFDRQVFCTQNFKETEWKQAVDIIVSGKKTGSIEVYYLTEKPEIDEGPFLKEERALINGISDKLGIIFERNQAVEALELKNKEILEFTDVITHDLKKPLATIKTICNLVSSEQVCTLNEDGKEAVMMGNEAIGYMKELLEDLLACAKLETGTHSMEFEDININEMVDTVLQKLKLQAQEKNIKITQKIDGTIYADRKSMTKVFMNLIGNAINYVGNNPNPEIIINSSLNKSNNEHLFYIKDNGIGIPKDVQKDIFQKFKRGNNVTGISGTGLGLAIVKASVEAHGGKIWLESKEGEGTTFYFTLPKNT